MIELNKLKKTCDILNLEGTILALYKFDDIWCLSSYLKDKSGYIYFRISNTNLRSYINSEFTLEQLFSESDDFMVVKSFRKEAATYIKSDFVGCLQFGEILYSNISSSLKSVDINSFI
jgi:hypothetical protein